MPVLAGLAWMATQGAPTHYLAVNGGSLLIGLVLVQFVPLPKVSRDTTAAILAAVLFLPFLAGPEINGVHRWVGAEPIGLNAGLLAFPALAVMAARMERGRQIVLSIVALTAVVAQPDAALGLAVGTAAIGIALANRDTQPALAAIAALLAAIWAQKRGVLPAVEFVERVYADAASINPLWLILLVGTTMATIALIALDRSMPRAERYAIAGALSGFAYTAAISEYPSPLVGYGAAPILGLALALWLARAEPSPRAGGDIHRPRT